MDFKREAERLMAATTPNFEGGIGMRPSEWRDIYGDRPETIEDRDLIALWLEDFLSRAIRDIESQKGEAILESLLRRTAAAHEAEKRREST